MLDNEKIKDLQREYDKILRLQRDHLETSLKIKKEESRTALYNALQKKRHC